MTLIAPNPVWMFIQALIALAASGKRGTKLLEENVESLAKQAEKSPEEIRQTIKEFSSKKDAWRSVLGAITDERIKHAIM